MLPLLADSLAIQQSCAIHILSELEFFNTVGIFWKQTVEHLFFIVLKLLWSLYSCRDKVWSKDIYINGFVFNMIILKQNITSICGGKLFSWKGPPVKDYTCIFWLPLFIIRKVFI